MAAAQVSSSRAKLTGRAAVLLLVAAVLAVSYASSMRAWLKQRSDINTLNAQIAGQRADVASLRETKGRLQDPAYIESLARKRFGWILPGETGYRVIGSDGEVLSDGGSQLSEPADPAAGAHPEWWQDAYATVVAAGEEPQPTSDASTRGHLPSGQQGTGKASGQTSGHAPRPTGGQTAGPTPGPTLGTKTNR